VPVLVLVLVLVPVPVLVLPPVCLLPAPVAARALRVARPCSQP
jgi:hypothetical protein